MLSYIAPCPIWLSSLSHILCKSTFTPIRFDRVTIKPWLRILVSKLVSQSLRLYWSQRPRCTLSTISIYFSTSLVYFAAIFPCRGPTSPRKISKYFDVQFQYTSVFSSTAADIKKGVNHTRLYLVWTIHFLPASLVNMIIWSVFAPTYNLLNIVVAWSKGYRRWSQRFKIFHFHSVPKSVLSRQPHYVPLRSRFKSH